MKQWSGCIALALAIALGALGGCGEGGRTPDAAMPMDSSQPDMGRPDAGSCECSGVSTCCDGCEPRNLNEWCTLAASTDETSFGTCDAFGDCSGTPVVCAHGPCQSPSIPSLPACVYTTTNEGSPCDDRNAATYGDVCTSGTCAGETCTSELCITRFWNGSECAESTPLGDSCDDGDPMTGNDVCIGRGECSGTDLDCVPNSGPCCDSAGRFRPASYRCLDDGVYDSYCTNSDMCEGPQAGSRWLQYGHRACSGSSAACDGAVTHLRSNSMTCNSAAPCHIVDGVAGCFACP